MRAHQSLCWSSKTDSDTDSDENTSEAHKHTSDESETKVLPRDREIVSVVLGEGDEEAGEDEEFKNGSVEGLRDSVILWLVLANKEVLSGNNCWATKTTEDSEDTVKSFAATATLFKLFISLDLTSVATSSGTNADDASDHKHDANQVEPRDFLTEAEVECDDVDETCEGEESGDDTLVDVTELGEVPCVCHHDQVADIDADVSEEWNQVRPLEFSISPHQTRLVARLGPSTMFASVRSLSNHPDEKEDNKDAGSAQTTTFESKISIFGGEDSRTSTHKETGSERARDPVTVLAEKPALFELLFHILGCWLFLQSVELFIGDHLVTLLLGWAELLNLLVVLLSALCSNHAWYLFL